MPIRRSPNGARHVRPQPGRNRPERVVAINRNAWSQSVGTGGRNHPVRALQAGKQNALGFVEGFNNKIRVLQRRAYGLRDEEYLRLKILTASLPEL